MGQAQRFTYMMERASAIAAHTNIFPLLSYGVVPAGRNRERDSTQSKACFRPLLLGGSSPYFLFFPFVFLIYIW